MQSFWLLLSTFLTTLTYALVKLAPEGTAFYDIFLVRSAFMALVILVIAAVSKTSLKTRHPRLQCFRILCGVTALCVNIIAVQHMSVVLFQTLVFTAPLFVAAYGMVRGVLLKRFPDPGLLLSIAAGFIGVLLVMRPGVKTDRSPLSRLGSFPDSAPPRRASHFGNLGLSVNPLSGPLPGSRSDALRPGS